MSAKSELKMTPEQFKKMYQGEFKPLVENEEQLSILKHTRENRLFCGESHDMTRLVENGLMEYAGRKSFVPDPYFKLTAEGRKYLNSLGL